MTKALAQLLILPGFLLFSGCHQYPPNLSQAVREAKQEDNIKLIKVEDVKGCYELILSHWKPDLEQRAEDAKYITPPNRIQLLGERGAGAFEKDGFLVRPAPGAKPSIHRFSYWAPTGPHTIYIAWTTGFSGLTMELESQGPVLRGEARSFWDFSRQEQTADVVARRFECGLSTTRERSLW